MPALAHDVLFDQTQAVSDSRRDTLSGSAIALASPGFVRPEVYWRHGFRRGASLSSEVLALMVAGPIAARSNSLSRRRW